MKQIQTKQEQKQKALYERFLKIVEKDKKQDYILPKKKAALPSKINEQTLRELVDEDTQLNFRQLNESTFEKVVRARKDKEFVKCFESISFSEFNPAPSSRKLVGDLFYLTVKTLDVGEKGITCSVNGFFLNESAEKTVFNPQPC